MEKEMTPLWHICHDEEGNPVAHEVTPYDIEDQTVCKYCGDKVAPLQVVLAAIYSELVEP